MKFLFDASSLFQLIKNFSEERILRLLGDNCILDLTKYEVGNALWKEQVQHRGIGENEFREFLNLLRKVIQSTKILSVDAEKLPDVAEVAARERMTFYDASYIAMAKVHGVTLITEDSELTRAASKYIKATPLGRIKPA